jgi:glycosyltransferase 2 family protein
MWRLVVKAAISAALLWLLLRPWNVGALLGQMKAVGHHALLGGTALIGAGAVVLAARWSTILRALGSPRGLGTTVPLIWVGRFFSQALPSGIGGDVMRMWLGCKAGLLPSVAISSVMADRLTGVLAVLLMVSVELPVVLELSPSAALIDGLVLVLIAGYGGILTLLVLDRLPATLHRFRLVRGFRQFSRDLRAVILSPRAAAPVVLCGVLAQVGDLLAVFALARGLGLNVSLSDCLVIVPLSNLVQALPISIAGWGVREGFFVAAFGMAGIAAPQALAISILFGLINLLISLPGGVLWLMNGSTDQRELRAAAKQAEPAAGS